LPCGNWLPRLQDPGGRGGSGGDKGPPAIGSKLQLFGCLRLQDPGCRGGSGGDKGPTALDLKRPLIDFYGCRIQGVEAGAAATMAHQP
jgi:hypothetical protein